MDELIRFNRAMVTRQEQMTELKREVNELCRRVGEADRWPTCGGQTLGEERSRQIVESATGYAILTLEERGLIDGWNPGAKLTFRYAEAVIVGRTADVLFTPEGLAAGTPAAELETARQNGRASDERCHVRRDGNRFYASGVLSRLADGGFVKVARDLTHRKLVEDELDRRVAEWTTELAAAVEAVEAEMDRRRELARHMATAQDVERRRVARHLHDTLGQLQAGLGLAVAAVRTTQGLPVTATDRLAELQWLVDELAHETHALALRLRPTALNDLGLEPALPQLVSDVFTRSGLEGHRMPPEVETAVYRLTQEALTNVTRHPSREGVESEGGGANRSRSEGDGRRRRGGFRPSRGRDRTARTGRHA